MVTQRIDFIQEVTNLQIKLSKNVAVRKLQSLNEEICLSESCQSLETQPETEIDDTTCGALDIYNSDDAFNIVKWKIEEENNNGEDLEKSDETTAARSYWYPDPGQTGTPLVKKVQLLFTLLLLLHCFPGGHSIHYDTQGQEKSECKSSPTWVHNSSNVSLNDLTSCNQELNRLQCESVKACITDIREQLRAVCTDNLCLTGHACPEVTFTRANQRMVVQSKENKCNECSSDDDLIRRLQKFNNIGKECLPPAKSTGTRPTLYFGLTAACFVIMYKHIQ